MRGGGGLDREERKWGWESGPGSMLSSLTIRCHALMCYTHSAEFSLHVIYIDINITFVSNQSIVFKNPGCASIVVWNILLVTPSLLIDQLQSTRQATVRPMFSYLH